MKKSLLHYMINRYDETKIKPSDKGPVVTLSRDYGCNANNIARKLIEEIEISSAGKNKGYLWQWINKEILELTAKELKIPAYQIEHLSVAEQKGLFADVLTSFGQHYSANKEIRKTLANIIMSFADEGHVIIVGRGGVSLTRSIQRSLHISMQAPLKFRVNEICKKRNLPYDEVEKITKETDKKRKLLRDYFIGQKTDNSIFDVIYNTMTMTEDMIVMSILNMMKTRGFI